MHRCTIVLFVTCATVGACGGPAHERPVAAHSPKDKAALFGDPMLVPTRAGERARHELALAAQIDAAARVLPGIDAVAVDVETKADDEPRVVVVARAAGDAELAAQLRDEIEAIAHGIVGPAHTLVHVASVPAALETSAHLPNHDDDRDDRSPLLLLALLGLGVSLGIMVERLRTSGRRR